MGGRSKFEIRALMLKVASGGAKKTQIVYGAYLNFDIVKPHLSELLRTGRIEQRGNRYYTTQAGAEYVTHVEAIA